MAGFGTGRGLRVSRDSGLYRHEQHDIYMYSVLVPEFASSMILLASNQKHCATTASSQKRAKPKLRCFGEKVLCSLVRLWREIRVLK